MNKEVDMSEFTKELLVLLLFLLLFIPVVYQGFRQKKEKDKTESDN